jgi:hypothetical protein
MRGKIKFLPILLILISNFVFLISYCTIWSIIAHAEQVKKKTQKEIVTFTGEITQVTMSIHSPHGIPEPLV